MIKVKQFNRRKKIKINKENRDEFNFKEVALTKMAKRQLLVTLFSILGVTIISLGSAYAVFTSISKSADYNVVKVGTLNIDFGEDSSNTIELTGQYPMSDEEGLTLTPYTFTIKNTGTLTADYEVFIEDDTDLIDDEGCSNVQLNKDYIKFKLDTGEPTILSSIAGSNYKIASGTLEPNATVTYTLYVWIREGVGNDVLNKHYHGKIVVNGTNKQAKLAVAVLKVKANAETLEYNTATDEQKKEMWTFTHPATAQTEALTDYRYIGSDPNNNVTFNNEIWRIIGIFTTDDGTGKLEERLKIIRNDSTGNNPWDSNGVNNWPTSTLNTSLNNEYYFTLSSEAKEMIDDVKWYLGGTRSYSSASNGLVSNFYSYERGTTVYSSNRSTSYVGKIGLMYPSDYGYATSGGTTTNREACLNKELFNWSSSSVSDCKNNNWLYDSSKHQWCITPVASSANMSFVIGDTGYVSHGGISTDESVRPVVYLMPDIKITDGNGSLQNPFELEL